MRNVTLATALVGALFLAACAPTVDRPIEAQSLVDESRWTIEHFKARGDKPDRLFRAALADAHGIVIFPNVVKGSLLLGAEGGSGVLLRRDKDGSGGYPAFYVLGAGSFGLQAGGQSSEVVLILRSPGAVQAVIDNQSKLGGDIQMTLGNVGAGLEAATTTNVGADIVGFSHAQGIYAGISLEGAVIGRRNDLNEAYYGPGATPDTIVFKQQFQNAQADPLRDSLVMN